MPATNAVSKRSLVYQNLLKVNYASKQTKPLDDATHKHMTDSLHMKSVANEFVAGSEHY